MQTITVSVRNMPGETAVLSIRGAVDQFTSEQLKAVIISVVEGGGRRLILDLGQVDHIDSAGMAALISGLRCVQERQGSLSLFAPSYAVRRILQVTRLGRLLPVYEREGEVLALGPQ